MAPLLVRTIAASGWYHGVASGRFLPHEHCCIAWTDAELHVWRSDPVVLPPRAELAHRQRVLGKVGSAQVWSRPSEAQVRRERVANGQREADGGERAGASPGEREGNWSNGGVRVALCGLTPCVFSVLSRVVGRWLVRDGKAVRRHSGVFFSFFFFFFCVAFHAIASLLFFPRRRRGVASQKRLRRRAFTSCVFLPVTRRIGCFCCARAVV